MPFKDLNKRREYQREYQKKWKQKNRKRYLEIRDKYEQSEKGKKNRKKWWKESPKAKEIRSRFFKSEKGKKYHSRWVKENKDKVSEKYKRYYSTDKGILNHMKKVQKRKTKFKNVSGVYYNVPDKSLVTEVNKRDKVCVYCGCKFSDDKTSNKYRSYDHLNPNKPHSISNTVKCCISCNSSKQDRDVWEWLKIKGLTPAKIIYDLTKS